MSGVVVDIPADGGGFATLIAMSEGTTSLYLSTGGGVIGAGQHPSVGAANRELRQTAQATLPSLSESSARAHPPAGFARIFVLTPAGRRAVDVADADFWCRSGTPPSELIVAIQRVITAVHQTGPLTG